jgi:tRNA(Ile)-lysidine synthase
MILKTVLRTIEHYKLLPPNQTLIIGVSGGTDSLTLFHIIVQLQAILIVKIHIATLNHGIRGQESEADVEFVKQIAEQWNIPYTVGFTDVPQLAEKEGIGIEEAARQARYQFLAEVAQQQATQYVAVAHHADDQAETILMHIIRGSGLKGLRGMEFSVPMPNYSHVRLIRPLLQITRKELEQYCFENQLSPRHDVTNDDINYQRNFIRHEIMSQIRIINPSVTASILRLGDIAGIEDDYVTLQFESVILPSVKQEFQRWSIPIDIFQTLHEALKRRLFLTAFYKLTDSAVVLGGNQIIRAIEVASLAQVGLQMDLGQGIRLRLGYEDLYIEHKAEPIGSLVFRLIPPDTHINLSVPSQLRLNSIKIGVSLVPPSDESVVHIKLPRDVSLTLRTRQAGDRFQPIGMKGHSKKVKAWMIDRKIPRQLRDKIPLLVTNDQIIAICVDDTWHLADLSQYIIKQNHEKYLILG